MNVTLDKIAVRSALAADLALIACGEVSPCDRVLPLFDSPLAQLGFLFALAMFARECVGVWRTVGQSRRTYESLPEERGGKGANPD